MPISLDLDHIMGPFRSLARRDLTTIAQIFERLGEWLKNRVKKADLLDEASRSFPVIRFRDNDAVMVWIDELQHGALAPPPSVGEQLGRAGGAFVHGVARIPESVRESQILPRFIDTVDAALTAVLASLDRFEVPTSDTFDPHLRRAGDLFGELALVWRAAIFSKAQIKSFLFDQVLGAREILKEGFGGGEAAGSLGIAETLDGLARYIVGGLLILAALPALISSVWRALSITIRAQLLSTFREYEELGYELRRTVIDFFYVDLIDLVAELTQLLLVTELVVLVQFMYWGEFARVYTSLLLAELAIIVEKVTTFVNDVAVWLVNKLTTSVDGIAKFDLTPIILTILLGLPGALLAKLAPVPTFTVADLVSGAARTLIGDFLEDVITVLTAAEVADPLGIFEDDIDEAIARIAGLNQVLQIALTAPYLGPIAKTLVAVPPPFPNIFDIWFKTTGAPAIQKTFAAIGDKVPGEVSDVLNAAAAAAQTQSYVFDNLAAQSAAGLSATQIGALTRQADTLAGMTFGDDVEQMRDKVARGSTDLVAVNFERWLALGGFQVLGQVLPGYIGSMLDAWRRQELDGTELTVLLEQTSPQLLAKKAQLARARMQKLTINARRLELDDPLIEEIVSKFGDQITRAYQAGNQRIRQLGDATSDKAE